MKKRWLLLLPLLLLLGFTAALYRADLPAAELEATYAQAPSQFLDLADTRIHFRDEGRRDGPALLLLHGTAASLHTWNAWVARLAPTYRILRVDLQGYGLTGPNRKRDYSIDRQVETLVTLLDNRGVDRVSVAGNSLGGLIAWRLALAHPQRVENLILISAAGAPRPADTEPPTASGFRMIDLAKIPVLRSLLTKLTPRSLVRSALQQVYGDPTKLTEANVDRYYRMLLREGNRQALVDAMGKSRGRRASPRGPDELTQPTLILWGALDSWIPVEHAERFQKAVPHAEVVIYPDLGHVPMEEDPTRTADDAARFLTEARLTF